MNEEIKFTSLKTLDLESFIHYFNLFIAKERLKKMVEDKMPMFIDTDSIIADDVFVFIKFIEELLPTDSFFWNGGWKKNVNNVIFYFENLLSDFKSLEQGTLLYFLNYVGQMKEQKRETETMIEEYGKLAQKFLSMTSQIVNNLKNSLKKETEKGVKNKE